MQPQERPSGVKPLKPQRPPGFHNELCRLFDQETAQGQSMAIYSRLLTASVDSIVATFRRRVAAGLQSSRDFVIPDRSNQATDHSDFELVTWLVIKGEK